MSKLKISIVMFFIAAVIAIGIFTSNQILTPTQLAQKQTPHPTPTPVQNCDTVTVDSRFLSYYANGFADLGCTTLKITQVNLGVWQMEDITP